MFNRKTPREKTGLELAIDHLHASLSATVVTSEEYATIVGNLDTLYKLREHDAPRQLVSPDTVVLAVTNLLGIALIVGHERAHVVTSKALTFVTKLR